jgi:hypothetical protein
MALLPGSPAIDAGSNAFFPLPVPSGLRATVEGPPSLFGALATFFYRVTAFNLGGESLASTEVSATTLGFPIPDSNSVTLSWNAVPGATGYKVYGRTRGSELFLGTSPAVASPSFTDTFLITPGSLPPPPIPVTTTDQRGFTRISGAAVDIGAFEVQQPSFKSATLPSGRTGVPYSETITATATGGAAGPLTFSLASGKLPPGLTLASDGTLSGMPTAGGAFSFAIAATDRNSDTGIQRYTLAEPPGHRPLHHQDTHHLGHRPHPRGPLPAVVGAAQEGGHHRVAAGSASR